MSGNTIESATRGFHRGGAVVALTTRSGVSTAERASVRLLVEPFDHRGDRVVGLLLRLLADRGQIDVTQPCQHAVVVPGYRDLAGHVDSGAAQRIDNADREAVVGAHHRSRQIPASNRCAATIPADSVKSPSIDFGLSLQAVPAHRAKVAVAAIGGDDTGAAGDVDNLTVAESDEVIDDRPDPRASAVRTTSSVVALACVVR